MASIYLPSALNDAVREKQNEMERDADADEVHIPGHEALFEMFDDEWQRRVRQNRGELDQ